MYTALMYRTVASAGGHIPLIDRPAALCPQCTTWFADLAMSSLKSE